jgi:hypothetical protein
MPAATLLRTSTSDQGTLGVLVTTGGFECRTIELPWRDNRRNRSCIPEGQYECAWIRSDSFGPVYWVKGVPGRSGILIHPGNLAGDRELGFTTHSYGCILPGKYDGRLGEQRAVLVSRATVTDLERAMGRRPFTLTVKEMFRWH